MGESVFLQDANSIIVKTDDLVDILTYLRETFPQVTRITSYCRSKTACRKSVEEFRRLKEAGLNRIHIGLESGYDPVLEFIRKGVTAEEHIEGAVASSRRAFPFPSTSSPGWGNPLVPGKCPGNGTGAQRH